MVKNREIMTIKELSEYLKIAKSTLYKLAQEGRLPGQKVGKRTKKALLAGIESVKKTLDRSIEQEKEPTLSADVFHLTPQLAIAQSYHPMSQTSLNTSSWPFPLLTDDTQSITVIV